MTKSERQTQRAADYDAQSRRAAAELREKYRATGRLVICATCGKVQRLAPGENPAHRYAGLHTCRRRTELPCPVCKGSRAVEIDADGNEGMCGVCNGAGRFLMPLHLAERDRIEEALNQ